MLHINWRQLEIDNFLTVCISNGRNSIALCLQTSTNIRVVELGLYTRQTDRQTDTQTDKLFIHVSPQLQQWDTFIIKTVKGTVPG